MRMRIKMRIRSTLLVNIAVIETRINVLISNFVLKIYFDINVNIGSA